MAHWVCKGQKKNPLYSTEMLLRKLEGTVVFSMNGLDKRGGGSGVKDLA